MLVATLDVDLEDAFEVRRFTTRIRSRHSRRTLAAVSLMSRSWIKNRLGTVRSTNISMIRA
jgi:hypothetical protein